VWAKANPNLGVSLKKESLATACAQAIETPSAQNTFRRLHLNQWTQQSARWIDLRAWDACPPEPVDLAALRGLPCWGGLDLSTTIDLTAFVLCWPLEDGTFALHPEFWIPEENMRERERRDRVPYSTWVRQGFVRATPGDVVDYEYVRARVSELAKEMNLREIAYDPWNATHLCQALQDKDGLHLIEHRQGYVSMSPPSKELERLVIQGRIRHGGNPVLRWNVDCAEVTSDPSQNIKPVKPDRSKSGKRIDGLVASIMALGQALNVERRGVYEGKELLVI
ncbi:MAG TPA: terminase TerL endonuclease subunit, partial [Sumerlaeia bacterium]|nr:terminase TerL endonuclease subunit [Sumerlaeia bacterium]